MRSTGLLQASRNRRLERSKIGLVVGIQPLLFDKLPQTFDQVQVRGIGRKKASFNVQFCGSSEHQRTLLIAGIIQHHSNRKGYVQIRQLMQ